MIDVFLNRCEFIVYKNLIINYNDNSVIFKIEFSIKVYLLNPQRCEITHVKLDFGNDNGILELKSIEF